MACTGLYAASKLESAQLDYYDYVPEQRQKDIDKKIEKNNMKLVG